MQICSPSEKTKPNKLAALIQTSEWILRFEPGQNREEAHAIYDWSFTEHFSNICAAHSISDCVTGEDPPDFELKGTHKIAVEVCLIVTAKKAVFEKAGAKIGGYASTLLNARPTPEFCEAARAGMLPDNSRVRPLAIDNAELDACYYEQAEKRITAKISAAKHYGPLYEHSVILLHDELSELEPCLQRRLPRLRNFCRTLNVPETIDVIVMNSGLGATGVAHVIT